jgi:pimeloyl-ACP methyl ester carboxylesterase
MTTTFVRSHDGVSIAVEKTGRGAPLLLVHGTSSERKRWRPVLPAFESRFTVYALDRRGRGGSGDSNDYSLEHEIADITAVIDSIDSDALNVVAHSFGALVTLEAVRRTNRVRKLVVYEPPIRFGERRADPEEERYFSEQRQRLARDDRAGVLEAFYRRRSIQPEVLEQFRAQPNWPDRLATAHTLIREGEAVRDYHFDHAAFRAFEVPTLLILGGDSMPLHHIAARELRQTLPSTELVVLAGQQHDAIDTDSERFAAEVLRFLTQ